MGMTSSPPSVLHDLSSLMPGQQHACSARENRGAGTHQMACPLSQPSVLHGQISLVPIQQYA